MLTEEKRIERQRERKRVNRKAEIKRDEEKGIVQISVKVPLSEKEHFKSLAKRMREQQEIERTQ